MELAATKANSGSPHLCCIDLNLECCILKGGLDETRTNSDKEKKRRKLGHRGRISGVLM